MTEMRPIKPIIGYIKGKMTRQWGALTGLGEIKLGVAKRARLQVVDAGLNLIGGMQIGYLRLLQIGNRLSGQPDEFSRLPLEEARVRLGKVRGRMKINSIDGQVLNHSPDYVCFLDLKGNITWLNATMIEALGGDTAKIVGRSHFELLHPDDQPLARERFVALVATGRSNPLEARFRKNGSFFWGWIVGRVLQEMGKPVGVALNIRDVTERKEKEIKMIVNERLRFLRQIWLGMNHEFNNAFVPILLVLENVEQLLEKGSQEVINRCLRQMAGNAGRIRQFTDRLHYFLQFSGRAKARTDLRALVEGVAALMQEKLNAADATFEIDCPRIAVGPDGATAPDRFLMELHFDGMEMILIDLLNNAAEAIAARHAADGQAPRRIKVSLAKEFTGEQRYFVVKIRDTGCGIKPENIGKLFQPFFSTKPAGEGTGLGLVIVQQIVREHGGTVEIASQENEGTEIALRLPVDSQDWE